MEAREVRNQILMQPVLVQTEVTYGCPICFTPIPRSMVDGHAGWHASNTSGSPDTGSVIDSAIRNDREAAASQGEQQ